MEDRLADVLEGTVRVRAELGYASGRHSVVELVDRLCRRDDRAPIAIERPGLSLGMERRARTPPGRETVGAL